MKSNETEDKNDQGVDGDHCGPGCGCGSPSGVANGTKLAICLVVALAAAAVVARGFVKNSQEDTSSEEETFAAVLPDAASEGEDEAVTGGDGWGEPLESLANLDRVAGDKNAVFVYIPADDPDVTAAALPLLQGAAQKIELRTRGRKSAVYMLARGTKHYSQITADNGAPCVLTAVKGRGASVVTGEITEKKLLQAYVNASRRPTSCCPPGTTCE